jgi:hypothetical protein
MPCEDQPLIATKTCTTCRVGFTPAGAPLYAPLAKRGRFYCCEACGASYGAAPHPDLR